MPGFCFLCGGAKFHEQSFNHRVNKARSCYRYFLFSCCQVLPGKCAGPSSLQLTTPACLMLLCLHRGQACCSLLLMACISLAIPTAAHNLFTEQQLDSRNLLDISHGTAVVLVCMCGPHAPLKHV